MRPARQIHPPASLEPYHLSALGSLCFLFWPWLIFWPVVYNFFVLPFALPFARIFALTFRAAMRCRLSFFFFSLSLSLSISLSLSVPDPLCVRQRQARFLATHPSTPAVGPAATSWAEGLSETEKQKSRLGW